MKLNKFAFFCLFLSALCSCKDNQDANSVCIQKFKAARKMVYTYPAPPPNQQSLDTALELVNESLICDSVRKAAVELKLALLITMGKFSEGISFVDSLKETDFTYNFQKKMMSKNLQALNYQSKKDTVKRNIIYQNVASDLETYIKEKSPTDKEFEEIFIYLYSLKDNFLDSTQINKEVDSLIKQYPNKERFFGFFKK